MSTSSEKDKNVPLKKLEIIHLDLNANISISNFKPKLLEAIDNLKDTSHKNPRYCLNFDFNHQDNW